MEQLHFLGTAKPKIENWLLNMTEEEKAIMAQHFAYVNELFSEGKVIFTGACLDGAMGVVVYKAESEETAYKMFENDPLVKSGITNTEFHPFRTGHIQKS